MTEPSKIEQELIEGIAEIDFCIALCGEVGLSCEKQITCPAFNDRTTGKNRTNSASWKWALRQAKKSAVFIKEALPALAKEAVKAKREKIARFLCWGDYIDEVEHEVRLEEADQIIALIFEGKDAKQ